MKTTQNGFSLVEVVLALGVSGLLLYGLTTVTQNSNTGQQGVKTTADVDNFMNLVTLKISDPTRCLSLLGQSTLSSAVQATTPASLNSNQLPALPAGVTLVSTNIQNMLSTQAPQATISWPAQIVFTFQKNTAGTSPTTITRTVPFLAASLPLTPNPAAVNITACGPPSVSANLQQACESSGWIWNPDPNAINNQPPWTLQPPHLPACIPSSQSACQALGGTLDSSTPPKCLIGPTAPPVTVNTVTYTHYNYTDVTYTTVSYSITYLCMCKGGAILFGSTPDITESDPCLSANEIAASQYPYGQAPPNQNHPTLCPLAKCDGQEHLAFCSQDLSSTRCGEASANGPAYMWACSALQAPKTVTSGSTQCHTTLTAINGVVTQIHNLQTDTCIGSEGTGGDPGNN